MNRLLLLAAVFLTLLTMAPTYAADSVPVDGKTCFCLEHRKSKRLLKGCTAIRGLQDFYPSATCWDIERQKKGDTIRIDSDWAVISSEQNRCTPCDPRPKPAQDEPRGSPFEPRGATPTPPKPPHWNTWLQQGAAAAASDSLTPGHRYRFILNLAGYNFSHLRKGAVGSVAADPAVQELLRTTTQSEVSFVIRPVLLGRNLRFVDQGSVQRTMRVVLSRLRAKEEDTPLIKRYAAGEIGPSELSSALGAGQIEFDIAASTPGCAAIALSIWSEDGLFPLDHLVHTVGVGAPGTTNCDADTQNAQQPLRGGLATLLETVLSLRGRASTIAAAAFHVFDTPMGSIAVFVDGRPGRSRNVYAWVLVSNLAEYLESPVGLAKVVEGARKRAAQGLPGSYVEAANELSLKLFSGQDDGEETANQAKAALQSLVAEEPIPPIIVARIVSSQLVNGRNRTAILPLGLLAAKGPGAILSKPITVVQPLPRERYSAGRICIRPWAFGIPAALDGVSDQRTRAALAAAGRADVPGQWFQNLSELKAYLSDQTPRRTLEAEGLLVLAHQGSGQLWFTDPTQRIQPEEIRRSYGPGSVAVFAACSVAAAGENNSAILERLNDRGIDGLIASPFPVPAQFGAQLALEFVAVIREERAARHTPTLAQIFAEATKHTADQLAKVTGGGRFEEMALEYVLLGDPNISLCAQSEEEARP